MNTSTSVARRAVLRAENAGFWYGKWSRSIVPALLLVSVFGSVILCTGSVRARTHARYAVE
jgi:hypothetical protein